MPAGRPPYYDNVEDLQKAIDDYFESCKGKVIQKDDDGEQELIPSRPITITGLALHLGFTTRQGLINYEEKPEFVDAIKKAKLMVEMAYEEAIQGKNAAGPIFALKNFGWTDRQEIDQRTTLNDERLDESKLTDEELRVLAEIQRKSRPSS